MDLNDVFGIAPQGAVLHLVNPLTLEPLVLSDKTNVTVTLLGPDSDEIRAKQRATTNKLVQGNSKKAVRVEDVEQDALDILCASIVSWTGMRIGTEDIECTEDNKVMLLTKYPHMRRQIDVFIGESRNFLKASVKS